MPPARLTELRLTEFKSFQDEVLPLGGLTMLIGRNAAGKSNALDALRTLSRLADGLSLRDALDGTSRAVSPIRGGSKGCAPAGRNQFTLGATAMEDGACYKTDITVQIGSELALTLDRIEWPDGALPHFDNRTRRPGFAALGRPGVKFEPADSPLAIQIQRSSAALSSALGDGLHARP